MKRVCLILGFATGIILTSRPCDAQYTSDFQTNTISGVTSNWSGGYLIGSRTFANVLLISNSGVLSNRYGYLGYSYGSSDNSVVVSGSGSVWSNSYELYVGYQGAKNSMVISNGGTVYSRTGYLGRYGTSSTNNSVLISSPGSSWNVDDTLQIATAGNKLVISNGGRLANDWSWVSGTHNSVLVTGTGSVWSNRSSLDFSDSGSVGNSLVISNGGQVVSEDSYLGFGLGSNSVLVTGAGSIWTTFGSLSIGGSFGTSSLMVTGGTVLAGTMTVSQLVRVDSGTVAVTNAFGTGSLVLAGHGKLILNGGTVTADSMIVTNETGDVITFSNGGWLRSGDTTVSNNYVFAVGDGTNAGTFYMTGGTHSFVDGLWIRTNAYLAGCGVVSGSVFVEGTVSANCGGMSIFTGTVTNYGRIEAENGTLLVFNNPFVNYGEVIATNGTVRCFSTVENHGTFLGDIQDGVNVWVNPIDGKWEDPANWSLGTPTSGYRCLITNSANKTVTIDGATASTHLDSLAVVDLTLAASSGSTNVLWMRDLGTSTPLRIGYGLTLGTGGRLVISNSAVETSLLAEGDLAIDGETLLFTAALIVTNAPTWVGNNAQGQLTATDSTVLTRETSVGRSSAASGLLTVTGNGSVWSNRSDFYLGQEGYGNSLVISSGGRVINGNNGFVGYGANSSNNNVLVTSSGSVWSNGSLLYIGYRGSNNNMVISNGGTVYSLSGYLGQDPSGSNRVLVTGTGSTWDNFGYVLGVGMSGAGNSLVISNGGKVTVFNGLSFVGGGNNNSVQVTGPGSVWSNGNSLWVGNYGSSNSLVISDGGQVVDGGGNSIGDNAGSNNSVLVVGTGSILSNRYSLYIGQYGIGNSLVISNGGHAINDYGIVGYDGSSSNNSVRVVDGGTWENSTLYVGQGGGSNLLVVAGGSVLATNLIVGLYAINCDNWIQVDSGYLIVTNASADAVFEVRKGKLILNGGTLQVDRFVMTNECAQFVRTGGTLIYGTAVLDPTRDDDGDGMPNGWEQSHSRDPLNAVDVNADTDGDGQSDLAEFQAGTDPTNSASVFRIIEIARESDDIRVTWAAAGGRTNVLQAANSVSGVYFNISSNFVIAGIGDVVTNWLDQGAATNVACRFYRVALRSLSVQDTNAPTLAITSPADDLVITNSTVTVTGTSADESGVSGVEVQGIAASSADGYSNWLAVVTGLADGTNMLTVLAGDNSAPANMATGTVRVICATGSFDGNGDGLPDGWQIKYFGSVDAPNAAPGADPDGDGLLNSQEFLDGTDPTLPAPAAPSGLTAMAVSTNQINLSWTDNATNEDGFAIERAPDNGGGHGIWTQIATVGANVTNYDDMGLTANTKYWYRVRASNTGGSSGYSNSVRAGTPALCPRLVVGWGYNNSGEATPPAGLDWVTAIAGGNRHSLALKSNGTVVGWGDNSSGKATPPAGLSNVVAIAAGGYFSLALKSDGTVTNWGDWYYGAPPARLSNVVAIAAGGTFGLALKSDGTVTNWGDFYGIPPAGLSNVVAIAARSYNSLALRSEGTVVGWGYAPTPPAGLNNVTAIAVGGFHCLALKGDGTVVSWGGNSTTPSGLSNVVAIAAGYDFSLALKSDGTVVGWGSGSGAPPPTGLASAVAIAAGDYHGLALTTPCSRSAPGPLTATAISSTQIKLSWLDNSPDEDGFEVERAPNVGGSPGAWTQTATVTTNATTHTDSGLSPKTTYWYRVRASNAGGDSDYSNPAGATTWNLTPPSGLTATGLSTNLINLSWSDNSDNEAGFKIERAPDSGGAPGTWAQIATVVSNTTAYIDTGLSVEVRYWYRVRAYNAIGNSDYSNPASGFIVTPPSGLTATAVSATQINLLWTDNSGSETGFRIDRSVDGTNFVQIAQVLPNTKVYRSTGLWPGMTYYYRVRASGTGGDSDFSSVSSAATPVLCPNAIVGWGSYSGTPTGLTDVVAISGGAGYSLALKSDHTVVNWGGGPTLPVSLSNAIAVAAGGSHSLALGSDGTVVGWGYNSYGQTNSPAGLTNAVAVAAGVFHSLALRSDGTVFGWGDNHYGQTNVPAGLRGVVAIAAGDRHSLALRSDGTVVGWGYNDYGQTNVPASVTNAMAVAAGGNQSLALRTDGTVVRWGSYSPPPPPDLTNVVAIAAGYDHSLALKSDGTVYGWGGNPSPPAGLTNVVAIAAGWSHSLALTCAPSSPSGLVATAVSTNQINLSWADNSSNEDRFGIERAGLSDGPWTEIGSVDFDVTTYCDAGLSCGQTYYYRVRAYNAAAGSPYSDTANANASPDDLDCDGIADSWMQQYFGHPYGQASDSSRATDDADGDGQNNIAEFQAGTDPTNGASAFRIIEIWPEDEDMFLTWTAVGGKWYVLQTSTGSSGCFTNGFVDLDTAWRAPGSGETNISVLHLGAATNAPVRFYRVRLVP